MRVKHIQIQGFKSFADRVYIELHPGITAIVGPNGSGKSNILDAIRWCLGEQSYRVLRGYSMEEVIFAGTDKRKPAGSAEVSITFELDDPYLIERNRGNRELKITRVLYRTGESEYLINDRSVRLRDITEFLMEAGLTSRSFSIIAQGEISDVISASPEDLRRYIDEAAGISRYRKRREETLKRMEKTAENLERVEDVLGELIRQQNKLKRQVNKAVRFEKLQMQRKALLRAKFKRSMSWLEKEIAELTRSLKEKNLGSALVKEELISYETKYSTLSSSLNKISAELEELTQNAGKKRENIERLQDELNSARQKLGNIELEIATLRERLNSAIKVHERTNEEMSERERKIEDLRKNLDEAYKAYVESLREYDKFSSDLKVLKDQVEKEREEYFAINQASAELSNKISQLQSLLKRIREQMGSEEKTKAEEEKCLTEKEEALGKVEDSIKLMEKEIEDLSRKYENIRGRWTEIVGEGETLKEKILRVDSSISSLKVRLETLRGFYRELMDDTEFNGRKRLGQHLTPRPGYERALGAAIGGALRWIVIESEDDLMELIGTLDRANLAKAGFVLTNGAVLREPPELPGDLISLWEVVDASDERVKHILRKYIVAPSVETAIHYSRQDWAQGFEFVTLSGERVFMGSVVEVTGEKDEIVRFFVTAEEIRRVERELETAESQRRELRHRFEVMKREEAQLTKEMGELEELLKKYQRKLEELKEQRSRVDSELTEIRWRIEGHSRRIKELSMEAKSIERDLRGLEGEKERLSRLSMEKKGELEELLGKLDVTESEWEKRRKEIEETRVKYESVKSSLSSLEESLKELKVDAERSQREETDVRKRLENLMNEKTQLEAELEGYERKLEELRAEYHHLQLKISSLNQREREITREMESLHREVESRRKVYDEIVTEAHGIELALAEKKKELDYIRKELADVGEVNNDLMSWAEAMDDEELSMTLSEVQTSIEKMGAINFSAKEEYEEVSERVQFIENQKRDLMSSLEDLKDALHKIDEECSRRVTETIQVVQTSFKEIISKLLDGADGTVSLVDPSDPIQSGVSIKVRLPGKKVKHLGLLSGGERAVVSFAFLFSLSTTARNPLFIFDEVDAPLDDANIGKFIHLLNEIKEKSQIILITHNKKTLKQADYVYGVTMEEKGVSKLFSISMED